jgi:hypothetical protein
MRQQQQYTTPTRSLEAARGGPVSIRIVEQKNDEGVMEVSLDYEKADVPSRAYFADYVEVLEGRADITLIFGRLMPGSRKLRTQVEISFARDTFITQLWNGSRDMHESMKKNAKLKLAPLEDVGYSDSVHTSRANNVFIVAAGEESIMDFYYIAPNELHFFRIGRRNQVNLEPVIRISLPTPLVLEFLNKCDALEAKMPEALAIRKQKGEEVGKE